VLFRGGDVIEAAAGLRTVLFDKTGTLTLGRPQLADVQLVAGLTPPLTLDHLIQLAASLESQTRHPLAHALLQRAQELELPLLPLEEAATHPGDGVSARLEGVLWRLGRPGWLTGLGVPLPEAEAAWLQEREQQGATPLALACGQQLVGVLAVQDQPRAEARGTLAALAAQGLRLGLLSGDRQGPVQRLAAELGLQSDQLAWELLPQQKLERIELARQRGPVAMVGDGINDAPALAAADVGIAVGTGTQIAMDTADLVVLGDRLDAIPLALKLARRTMATVRQNLAWAFGYNLLVLPIAAGALLPGFGVLLSPPLAALLMALSSLTVVVNALLLGRDA
jgi:Cu2+-exporting ATPase